MRGQQTITSEEKLRLRLSGVTNLPTPPVVFNQISKIIQNPNTSVKEVAAVMSEDAAMSAKVLRLSNSAFYGARHEITNIKQAVMVLGLEAVKSLVLSSSVFEMFKSQRTNPEFQETFWRHSLATALAGRLLVKTNTVLKGMDQEVAFSSGLLHDIGKLIICCFMQEDHLKIREIAKERGLSDYEAEEETLGYAHPLVGRIVAGNWKLPSSIQSAVEFHHYPQELNSLDYAVVIHAANYLAKAAFNRKPVNVAGWSDILPEVAERLGIDDTTMDSFCSQLVEEYSRSSTFMQMAVIAAA